MGKNEALLHAAAWMTFTGTAVRPVSQTKECTLCDSIFIMFKSRQKQFMLLEIRIVVTLGARCSLERNTRKRAFFGSESVFSLDMDGSFTGIFMRITELHT